MSNYFIEEFEGPDKPWPDPATKSFFSLKEYRTMAKQCIKALAPGLNIPSFKISEMLSSEDYISEVIFYLARADLTYDKEKKRTKRGWRNQQAIYCLMKFKSKKNKETISLDNKTDDGLCLYDLHKCITNEEPSMVFGKNERINKIKKYIQLLLANTDLTNQQREIINLKYFKEIESLEKVSKMLNPPISRQAVNQLLKHAIYKLKQTALGTS